MTFELNKPQFIKTQTIWKIELFLTVIIYLRYHAIKELSFFIYITQIHSLLKKMSITINYHNCLSFIYHLICRNGHLIIVSHCFEYITFNN